MSDFFKKAKPTGKRIKMFLYGNTGTGKTLTSLQFPSPAVIDTQRGTDHYAKDFDFDELDYKAFGKDPADPEFIEMVIDYLAENPGDYKTLVIDSMTDVYDRMVRDRLAYRKERTGNPNYELGPLDYGWLKGKVKAFVQNMLSLDLNIIATAETANEYDNSGGEMMKVVDTKPDGHKKIPHIFDVVIELLPGSSDQVRVARVRKDRTNQLPDRFEFTYEVLESFLEKDGLYRKADVDLQKTTFADRPERNHKIEFNGKNIKTAGIEPDTLEAIGKISEEVGEEKVKKLLHNDYLCSSLLDLKNDEGKLLIKQLTSKED